LFIHLIDHGLPKSNICYTSFAASEREIRMRLTVYTDYALRVLMYLALKEDRLATIAEIAERYSISRNHLMKVAHQLGVGGYVETVRGRKGG
jgi:DNA-binding MurR/RpiR family transcriptional regulator